MFIRQKRLHGILTLLVLSGFIIQTNCAISYVYKTKDIRKQANGVDQKLFKLNRDVIKDYSEKAKAFRFLIKSGANKTEKPYSALISLLKKMNSEKSSYQSIQQQYLNSKLRMMEQIQNKKEVKDSEPEFQTVKLWRDNTEGTIQQANSVALRYSRASKEFVEILNQNNIYRVDLKNLKSKVDNSFAKLEASAKKNREFHQQNKRNMRFKPEKLKLISQADENLDRIDALLRKAKEVAEEFVKEVGKQNAAFVAPHMKSHTVLSELKQLNNLMLVESNQAQMIYMEAKRK